MVLVTCISNIDYFKAGNQLVGTSNDEVTSPFVLDILENVKILSHHESIIMTLFMKFMQNVKSK